MHETWTPEFLKRRLEDAQKINSRLVEILAEYIRKNQNLSEEADAVEAEAVEAHERIADLRARFEEMTADRDGLRELLEDSEMLRESLAEDLDEARKKCADLEGYIQYWRSKAEESGSRLRELMKREQDLDDNLDSLADKIVFAYGIITKIRKEK